MEKVVCKVCNFIAKVFIVNLLKINNIFSNCTNCTNCNESVISRLLTYESSFDNILINLYFYIQLQENMQFVQFDRWHMFKCIFFTDTFCTNCTGLTHTP